LQKAESEDERRGKRKWTRSDFGCVVVLKNVANVERVGMG